jgi:negative regulator of sigma E activity
MLTEQLEFRISQYVDGTLPAAEAAALEQTLASDLDARALLEDYRKLDAALQRELPVPQMNWDRLAQHISAVVAQEEVAANDANRSYRIAWPMWGRVAIAAMVVIAVALAAFLHLRPRPTDLVKTDPTPAPPVILVTGPAPEQGVGPVVEVVSIQPSPLARNRYHPVEDVVYRAPRVVIASGQSERQDTGRLPF